MDGPFEQDGGATTCPRVAIIILNWNGWRDTLECLESLQRITYPNYRLVVVDNGSTDGSIDRIKAWASGDMRVESRFFAHDPASKPVHWIEYDLAAAEMGGEAEQETSVAGLASNAALVLIHNEENLGFSAGNNVAIRYALKRDFSLILLLNSDTVVDPDFLTLLVESLEINSSWMAVGPKILYKDDPGRIWYCGAKLKLWRLGAMHIGMNQPDSRLWSGNHDTEHIPGCCLLARKNLFEALGLLDEDFFFGHEDAALAYMARKAGMVLGANLDAVIYHRAWADSEAGSQAHAYYYNKYRLLVLRRHGALVDKIVGTCFFSLTRLVKWPQLIVQGRAAQVRGEIRAVMDSFASRYGDYDRRRANSHVLPSVPIEPGGAPVPSPAITSRPFALVSLLLLFFLSLESLPLPSLAQIIPVTSVLALVFVPFTIRRVHITPLFVMVAVFATFVLLDSAVAVSMDVMILGAGQARVLAWARQVAALAMGLSVFLVLRRTLLNTSARFVIYAVIAGSLPALAMALLNVLWGLGNQLAGSIVVGIRATLLPWGYNDPLRVSGLSLEPASFAFYLVTVVIPVALAAFTTSKTRWRWLALLASIFIAFVWTFSTTGLVVLSSLVLAGLFFSRRRALCIALLAAMVAVAVGATYLPPDNYAIWQIQNLLYGEWTSSIVTRLYSTAGPFMNSLSLHTLFGYGLGGTSTHLSNIVPAIAQADIAAVSWQNMPNLKTLVGRLMAETGLIGLTLAILVIVVAWRQLGVAIRTTEAISERSLLQSGRLALISLIVGYTITAGSFALPYLWFWLAVIDSTYLPRTRHLQARRVK